MNRQVVGKDAGWREAQFGSSELVGDQSDDEEGAEGERDVKENGFPAGVVAGIEAVAALGRREEAGPRGHPDGPGEVVSGQ